MAVDTPLISFWKETNKDTDEMKAWEIGVVDASQVSTATTLLIWNNRKGATNVPNAENAIIVTKDKNGGNTGELVEGQWIEVKVDQVDTTFNKIGWDTVRNVEVSRPISTTATTTFGTTISTPNVAPNTAQSGRVSFLGVANDGTIENSGGNFIRVQLQCRVPGNASSGLVEFRLRVRYQYL